MPRLVYALLCADLIIDRDSNSTSLIRTVEHAVVPALPATLPPLFFVSLWELDSEGGQPFTVSLTLTPPKGEGIMLGIQEVSPGATMLHKMNFQLPGLKVAAEGRHTLSAAIKTDSGWQTKVELPLFVFTGTNAS
ncbi:hypothetical protein GKC30_06760 [Pseudodesulfovibrio sp. F-1]|uniref:Uncharacterized protein n=1 Tax=Pseudodesulfovibrio alkaliphilus TaxID=2661613 RepID=A0A7K1KML9_9BACT|nr:hypothetical protein [Pseudodesulfovibrio alkaliphilus]MUM77328.1 hypothetical protein [Pseudodesulfovibrio alkaliphilus]